MSGICEGRVVIVTGAGRGIGRGHALEFAREGATVVVNDIGADVDGSGTADGPAGEVVDLIRAAGGTARVDGTDVSDEDGARRLIEETVEHYGDLHVLVNNAGILRDRMITNMTAAEWDDVIRVHLRGTFMPLRHASRYWKERSKSGAAVDARVINTTSSSGIYGNVGQGNYGAAKAGIASLSIIASMELARYGVTVNAVAPAALTRMTENLGGNVGRKAPAPGDFDPSAADNIAPLVVWLGSEQSRDITGRVFNVRGGHISVAEGWSAGPSFDKGARFEPGELGEVVPRLVAEAAGNAAMNGLVPEKVS
ncbi:SDR family NAD(P)-dependent oxidoreductase [Rhodococcus sp. BP-252]|uniref:SDR family oxidoreductase n=1 Tax=unclassified Rhodococcus (in: high G+C Gram-positive bacteria) TaxID=192944 RepID=UPI00142F52B3|nr:MULTISPECIES: SDR family oxidoreductase [unclassified Rhodococcus (in: high G+C Gram-positive bacteria)]MBY6410840.1 SDR family NAD(P)-dependent oxidoreductase [Rhodococcus sp. BP-320]MBY6415335.1 SDR family NAD(P)-dependent oxidoreductase [Rhodococcus sp. BP-321]MBY6419950.1 SDR family NAD(P)-dependent oxidoreductase [Rhodococcus sp. BP-324]MBY6425396.1 SDR family NAD(P)-dependent oxidoreductase [Rhodococcus sp. BP-323]MBY6430541.1 SDR family NAD(P)-dependent oxidoreductase [Rhodococcus sp